jgi:PAS domain S-box-containing protein
MGLIAGEINLLYVEDDPEGADVITQMLKTDKHIKFKIDHKTTLKCSVEALKKEDCDYDVVLLDLMLPNSQGLETYKTVRKLCVDIPIVIISGFSDIACECVKLGAQDYILKTDISPGLIIRSLRYAIERKRLENEKLLAENQFKDIMINTPLGAHLYELSDNELYFCGYNPAADKILNIDHSPLLGMKIVDAFPNIGEIREIYIQIIKTGEPWNAQRVDYEDENVTGSFSIYAFRTFKNRMATTFEDITVKAKMEDKLKQSEEKYRELVEVIGASIYKIDFITRKFTYVNDIMCKLSGWNREELLELGPEDVLTDQGIREFAERLGSLRRGDYISDTHEYEIKVKGGLTRWALITAIYEEDDEHNIIGARVVAIDITDRKVAEKKAQTQEQAIFSELENKLHQWKDEMTVKSVATKVKLDEISLNITSMSRPAEVQ